MARLVDCCPASDDELPRLQDSPSFSTSRSRRPAPDATGKQKLVPKSTTTSSARKVRRLGGNTRTFTNPLFQPWGAEEEDAAQALSNSSLGGSPRKQGTTRQTPRRVSHSPWQPDQDSSPPPARPHRTRRQKAEPDFHDESTDAGLIELQLGLRERSPSPDNADGTGRGLAELSLDANDMVAGIRKEAPAQEASLPIEKKAHDVILISDNEEEPSIYQTAVEDSSESSDGSASEFEMDNSSDESFEAIVQPRRATVRARAAARPRSAKDAALKQSSQDRQAQARESRMSRPCNEATELSKALENLQIYGQGFSDEDGERCRLVLPSTPPKAPRPGSLVSPRKPVRIPQTPHRPSLDAFWSQDFIDDWNESHSPTKPLLLPATDGPARRSPAKNKSPAKNSSPDKAAKKSFEARKRPLAEKFLCELDAEITGGKIGELAESTGGVKLVWTRTLNTTAGRANWRRETTRTKSPSGEAVDVSHKHHASIELAEKIIDSEDRLLNVLAHEFCHLANFMVSGITNNPHGKEFKAWAAKCSRAFGDSHGIRVTTKHSYDIDFKYAWACTTCGSEYKRHSRSIDPQRHRCGSCKGTLQQTKPAPRAKGTAGGGTGKPSEWQAFVREQMKTVRVENPKSPQKEVMKMIAQKWAKAKQGVADGGDDGPADKGHLA